MMSIVSTDCPGPSSSKTAGTTGAPRRRLLVVLLVALSLRLLVSLWLFPSIQQRTGLSPGSDGYELVADTLVEGGGYRFAPELGETMFLLPVYPLFLAGLFSLTDHHLLVTCIAQSLLDTLTCLLLYRIACPSLGSRVGLAGAIVYALYPGAWIACSRYLTEPLFVFLIAAFVLFFGRFVHKGRKPALLLAGVVLALAVLCKSVAGMLPVFLLGCAVVMPAWRGCRGRILAGATVCLAVVVCGAALWGYRNHRLTGSFVFPSTSGGLALYTAHVYAAYPEQRIRDSAHQGAREVRELGEAHGIRLDPGDAYPRWFYSPRDELKLDKLAQAEARTLIASDPGAFVKHVLGNLWRFWIGAPTPRSLWIAVAINVPLLLVGMIGFAMSKPWRDPAIAVWLVVSAYLFAAHVAILAVVRYSLTVMPFVCLLAGFTICRWADRRRSRKASLCGHETPC